MDHPPPGLLRAADQTHRELGNTQAVSESEAIIFEFGFYFNMCRFLIAFFLFLNVLPELHRVSLFVFRLSF